MKYETIRKTAKAGMILMFASLAFATIETIYFGSNWWSESKEELICDKIALGMCEAGCFLYALGIVLRVAQQIKDLK